MNESWINGSQRQQVMPRIALSLAAVIGLFQSIALPARAYEPQDLPSVEAMVATQFADVAHIPSSRLEAMLAAREPIALFDVREAAEFQVSRIAGAVRVDPGQWSSTFLRAHAGDVSGKVVVFYCSVGVRSSKLAARVQEALKAKGARSVYNLSGGVFRWHNELRSLVADGGPTEFVHPYDARWGGLVSRRELTAARPIEKPTAIGGRP
jgi:rhodanese-related sulfurtransferase